MRLTVNLDDDVHRLARAHAAAEDCSLSAAINHLLRRVLEREPVPSKPRGHRFPVSRCRERRTITATEVRERDIEDERP